LDFTLNQEGKLDIAPIPFNRKTEAVLSPFAKLVTYPSTHNISVYFNMLKPNGVLKNQEIRIALNEVINQENLLKFVYKNEGRIAPTAASRNYKSVQIATKDLPTHYEKARQNVDFESKEAKRHELLNGLNLKVYTLERFMFLWKGIEYQLNQYGVSLEYETTNNEKELYGQLLTNRENPKDWDLLAWGNDDWCSNHPWTVFFHYRTSDVWSAIDQDELMQSLITKFFELPYNSPQFVDMVGNITKRAYERAYMLFVPSPNIVLAVNKEVDYTPSAVLLMPLWETKITPHHWSIREHSKYPATRQTPVRPKNFNKKAP
jgi:ABC-type transport system substrate-binding protein